MLLLLVVTPVFAHPGHGETEGGSPEHYLVEPVHVLPVFAAILVLVLMSGRVRRRSRAV